MTVPVTVSKDVEPKGFCAASATKAAPFTKPSSRSFTYSNEFVEIDQFEKEIRSAFCDFEEGNEIELKVNQRKKGSVFETILRLFNSYSDNIECYVRFASAVLKVVKFDKREIPVTLRKFIEASIASKAEKESPYFWENLTRLMSYLTINSQLMVKDFKELIGVIYSQDESQEPPRPEEMLKWYLHDFHYFEDPMDFKFSGDEILEALRMPRTIEKNITDIRMSKLIAIAIVRSVFAIVDKKGDASAKAFAKYSRYLDKARKYPKTYKAEVERMIEEYDMEVSYDALAK